LISSLNHSNDACFVDGKPTSSVRPIWTTHQLAGASPTPPTSTPLTFVDVRRPSAIIHHSLAHRLRAAATTRRCQL
ncbi:hypothetical protein ACLOJK_007912, partial [Asimina triloba]